MPVRRRRSTARNAEWDAALRPLLFWSMLGAALLLFAACVLLPEWRETQEYAARQEVMQGRVGEMRLRVERQERTLEALRNDPQVIQRVAERELNYSQPGEELLHLPRQTQSVVAEGVRTPVRAPELVPLLPPALAAVLPAGPWVNVFCDSPDRTVCLTMAAVLFVSAFWLFPPRRRVRPARR